MQASHKLGSCWIHVSSATPRLAARLVGFAVMLTNACVKADPRLLPGVRRTKVRPRGHSQLNDSLDCGFTINECVNVLISFALISHARIGVPATVDPVVTQSTDKHVGVVATIDGVVAVATFDVVFAAASVNTVVAFVTKDFVVAAATFRQIAAASCFCS